ncbi:MAG: cobalt-precorrin-5B (C(1))-methyltransferase CbiD, partial [Bacillota bacterium]
TVTKPGLPIKEGKAAINPVPRKMIKKSVREVLLEGEGAKITITVPGGKKVAEKTFNPRLGIKGGISILGTTGIVEPMSESAYKESLAVELKQAVALGEKELVFVFGNHGKRLAIDLGYKKEAIIRMSNFVGYMLDQTTKLEIKSIVMVGHIGKIVKVAGGIFNTHSKNADARKEIIAAYTALCGGGQSLVEEIFLANTAEEISKILVEKNFQKVFNNLAKRVVESVHQRLDNNLSLSAIIFSLENGILGSYNCKEGIENE